MCHGSQLEDAYNKDTDTYDFTPHFANIKAATSRADLTIGNLETTLSGKDKKYSGYPKFNTPESYVNALMDAGFDVLTLANNHIFDKGWYGVEKTIENLNAAGIAHTGLFLSREEYYEPLIVDVKGVQVAILAYTYGTNSEGDIPADKLSFCIKYNNTDNMVRDIKAAREKGAEIVLVQVHWGAEYSREPSSAMREQAQAMFEAGADVIFGAHPHVLQPITRKEVTRTDGTTANVAVAYSLGNFISNQTGEYSDHGMMVTATFEQKQDGSYTLADFAYLPTYVYIANPGGVDDNRGFTILPAGLYAQGEATPVSISDRAKNRVQVVWDYVTKLIGEGFTAQME